MSINKLGVLVSCLFCMACINHEKMMIDSKYVFENENFIDFSEASRAGIVSLFRIVSDSINTLIPLNLKEGLGTRIVDGKKERVNYKYMNECIRIKVDSNDSIINSQQMQLRNQLIDLVTKIDTTYFNYIEACNYGPEKQPSIFWFKNQLVKGAYSYHLVRHYISNKNHYEPKNEIYDIYGELIKLVKISDEVVYLIGVSSDL